MYVANPNRSPAVGATEEGRDRQVGDDQIGLAAAAMLGLLGLCLGRRRRLLQCRGFGRCLLRL